MTSTTIPLTWTSAGSVVNSYKIEWKYDGECSGVRGGRATLTGDMTSYTIEGLEEYITYPSLSLLPIILEVQSVKWLL